jgi:hypothetical protein
MDNAITFANTEDNREALRRLAAATHFQSAAIGNLCLEIAKLRKAMQDLKD